MKTANEKLITYKCREKYIQYQTFEAFKYNIDCEVMLDTTAHLFSYNAAAVSRQKLADIAIMAGEHKV